MAKLESPLVLKRDNLIVTKAGRYHAAACYELEPIHFDFKKMDDYQLFLSQFQQAISKMYYSGMFLMAPTPYDPVDDLMKGAKTPEVLQESFLHGVQRMAAHIRQIPYKYRMYMIIFVEQESGSAFKEIAKTIAETFRDLSKKTQHALGGEPFTLAKSEWEGFKEKEEQVFTFFNRFISLRRLRQIEVDWLVSRCAMRGIDPARLSNEDYIEDSGELLSASPVEVMKAFTDVALDKKAVPGMLRFEKGFPEGVKSGYFSFMCVSRLPKGMGTYPGDTTIFKVIQELVPCPVEVCVQFQPISPEDVRWKLNTSRYLSRGKAGKEMQRKQEVSKKTREVLGESRALQEYLDETEHPMFKTTITICTWGETPEQVVSNREEISKALRNYELQVPVLQQKQLFYNTLPGFPKKTGYQYFLRLTTEWLAATMPIASTKLGDPYGFLIGYTGLQELYPVLLNPRRGSEDSRRASTGSCLIQGAPGGGKSVLGNYIVHQELMRGAKALIFDPKNERWHWPYELPYLHPVTNVVTLKESIDDQGKLDPLARVRNQITDTTAIASAKEIINYMANRRNDSIYEKVIDHVVNEVVEESNRIQPNMMRVVEKMHDYLEGRARWDFHPSLKDKIDYAAADIHSTLKMRSRSGLSRLLFNDGTNQPVDLSKQLTILQVQGLLSGTNQDESTDTRIRKVVFMAVLDLAREFADEEIGYRTVFIDEAYFITDDKEGASMLRILLRTGRSKRNNVILCLHNARDLNLDEDSSEEDGGGEVRSNVTNRFLYRLDDRAEAIKGCDLLGIPAVKSNVELLRDRTVMGSGSFMMRDFNGNVGLVRFNLQQVDPALYRCFNTSDPEILRIREEKFGHFRTMRTQEEIAKLQGQQVPGQIGGPSMQSQPQIKPPAQAQQ
ncbi:AAA-like domain-containing protein [Seinonella peptonophila]|uniref:AAA-like domain-containing protein n=1 Tax=Seinonella peptonophila TaxID=112248 RepID=A0A1M4XTP6_9BACL|nr:ATP-binding protein [Seinonella peptonophila]SHE96851.1 AAA-like domain-containing protein [Seinonella peptonophila]